VIILNKNKFKMLNKIQFASYRLLPGRALRDKNRTLVNAFSNTTNIVHTDSKTLFRNWIQLNATTSIDAPVYIFNGTEFIVAKGKNAPKALRDLRNKAGIYA
jgi:hypothetical protein